MFIFVMNYYCDILIGRILKHLLFSPDHLVDDGDIALDDLDHYVTYVLAHIHIHRSAVVVVAVHGNGGVDGLEEALLIDSGKDEPRIVKALGALRARAYADGREWMAHRGEEAALLWQRAGVGDYGGGVHLQAVVVVKAERLVPYNPAVKLESTLLQPFAAARMAAVEYRHVVLLRYGVDGVEQREEVLLRVYVLLAVGAQQYVFSFFKSETGVDVAALNLFEVLAEHFRHGGAGDIGTLLGQAAVGKVTAGMRRVAEVDIGYDIDYAAVGLLRQALVLTAVASLHVEDRYVQTLGRNGAQA